MRVAAIVLAVAACGGAPEQTATLELVDPGAEPRVQLRYTFDKLEREVSFVSVHDDRPGETFSDMRYRVTCERGGCRYQMVTFNVLREDFAQIKGEIHGKIRIGASGPIGITPGSNVWTTPSTPELMRAAVVPLPEQAIGVGARWVSVENGLRRNFKLVKSDGVTLVVDTDMSAADADAKVEQRGQLRVSLADPFAKGTMTVQQTLLADPAKKLDEHTMTPTTTRID